MNPLRIALRNPYRGRRLIIGLGRIPSTALTHGKRLLEDTLRVIAFGFVVLAIYALVLGFILVPRDKKSRARTP